MSGLQRRRVAAASEPAEPGAPAGTYTTDSSASSPTGADTPQRGHAGSALEGGGKVAYDPRDLEFANEAREGGKMPRLTLMEEVLLLGLKDRAVSAPAGWTSTLRACPGIPSAVGACSPLLS
jgi:Golgi phosphoprotein 3